MSDNQNHTHEFKYIAEPVKELVKELGDEIESAAHVFTVVHKHDDGHMPHHHTGTDVTLTADKLEPAEQDPSSLIDTLAKSKPKPWYEPMNDS
jgi:hypothetical protein